MSKYPPQQPFSNALNLCSVSVRGQVLHPYKGTVSLNNLRSITIKSGYSNSCSCATSKATDELRPELKEQPNSRHDMNFTKYLSLWFVFGVYPLRTSARTPAFLTDVIFNPTWHVLATTVPFHVTIRDHVAISHSTVHNLS
jgi:hypothetical protein